MNFTIHQLRTRSVKTDHIQVREVVNKSDFDAFFGVALRIYKDDKNWVCPLKTQLKDTLDFKNNPFWEGKQVLPLVAYINNEAVGRVVFFENPDFNTYNESNAGFFGFLESTNDIAVVSALFEAGRHWLMGLGYDQVFGPFNPSLNYELGILVEGFDTPPFVMMTHNRAYMGRLLEKIGLRKERDFTSYLVSPESLPDLEVFMTRHAKNIHAWNDISIRPIKITDFDNELKRIYQIYNDGFSRHWGFSYMSYQEFEFIGKGLSQIIDPSLFLIVEIKGEPAGFVMSIPNINELLQKVPNGRLFPYGLYQLLFRRKTISSLRISTMVVKQKFQHLGIGGLMYSTLAKNILNRGYKKAEISWIIEENEVMHHIVNTVKGQEYKKYRVYGGDL